MDEVANGKISSRWVKARESLMIFRKRRWSRLQTLMMCLCGRRRIVQTLEELGIPKLEHMAKYNL